MRLFVAFEKFTTTCVSSAKKSVSFFWATAGRAQPADESIHNCRHRNSVCDLTLTYRCGHHKVKHSSKASWFSIAVRPRRCGEQDHSIQMIRESELHSIYGQKGQGWWLRVDWKSLDPHKRYSPESRTIHLTLYEIPSWPFILMNFLLALIFHP